MQIGDNLKYQIEEHACYGRVIRYFEAEYNALAGHQILEAREAEKYAVYVTRQLKEFEIISEEQVPEYIMVKIKHRLNEIL